MRGNLEAGFALGLGLLCFGLSSALADASALGYRRACERCTAPSTTRIYKTIHPLFNVTRYHERAVYHYVTRLHYVVGVTRIQPVVHINDVTRVHHVTVVRDAYAYQPQALGPTPYGQPAPGYASGCGCMD